MNIKMMNTMHEIPAVTTMYCIHGPVCLASQPPLSVSCPTQTFIFISMMQWLPNPTSFLDSLNFFSQFVNNYTHPFAHHIIHVTHVTCITCVTSCLFQHDSALILTSAHKTIFILLHCSTCLLYTSPSPRDRQKSRMPSSA